ncbi:MAG: hypothetical protein IT365_05180 [Candidatus Hydrogenedentes bacterium]|nr:hypothetical protein [Candidatus Hydrogenedentota bacterium]
MEFSGSTYDERHDRARLTGQIRRVFDFMEDGDWHTIPEIAEAAGASETSASARVRDLRKPRFGSYTVQRMRVGDPSAGLWAFRLVLPPREPEQMSFEALANV